MKIKGLNAKEQKCYDILQDGEPHTIAELTKKFSAMAKAHCEEVYEKGSWDDSTASSQAQSFVRNSIRRLVRDGWIEKSAYGTYRLTRTGKQWVAKGKDTTASFGSKRGGRKRDSAAAPKSSKKAPAKSKKASSKKATTSKKSSKKTSKANGKSALSTKAKEAKKRAGKAAAIEKAQLAKQSVDLNEAAA